MQDETALVAACAAAARAGGRVLLEWTGRFSVRHKGAHDFVTEADLASQGEIRRLVAAEFPDHGFVGEEAEAGVVRPAPGTAGHSGTGVRWIVDPLDGTTNYVHGFPAWCVSVAVASGDEILAAAIHDPLRDECFTAGLGGGAWLNGQPLRAPRVTLLSEAMAAVSFPPRITADSPALADFIAVAPQVQAVRRTGSTALNLAWLACGRLHAFWARRIACWDVAAGFLILREAGGAVGPLASSAGHDDVVPLDDPAFVAASTPELVAALRTTLAGG